MVGEEGGGGGDSGGGIQTWKNCLQCQWFEPFNSRWGTAIEPLGMSAFNAEELREGHRESNFDYSP